MGVVCGEWFELIVCGGRNKDSFVEKGMFLLITYNCFSVSWVLFL